MAGDFSQDENFLGTYHINDGTNDLMDLSDFRRVSSSSGHGTSAIDRFESLEGIVANYWSGSEGSSPDSPPGSKSSKTAGIKRGASAIGSSNLVWLRQDCKPL